jgi:hypothetical protein
LGSYLITLAVNDGKTTGRASLGFEVITVRDALMLLAVAVEGSDLASTIKRQLGEALLNNSGNSDEANLLGFRDKVQSYVAPISPALALQWVSLAEVLLEHTQNP